MAVFQDHEVGKSASKGLLRRALPFVVMASVLVLFHARRLAHLNLIPREPDWLETASLYGAARKTILEFHQLPLRTHMLAGGFPALGHPFDASISPEMVLVLLFGATAAMNLLPLLYHLLAAMGMYLYMKVALRLHPLSAMYSALLLTLSSTLTVRAQTGCYNELIYAWLPLALFLFHRGQHNRSRLVLMALVLVPPMVCGSSAWTAFALYLGVYAVVHSVRWWRGVLVLLPWRPLSLALVLAGSVALAAPKVVSAFRLLQPTALGRTPTIRAHTDFYNPRRIKGFSWGELAAHLVSLRIQPGAAVRAYAYVGVLALILAAMTAVGRPRQWWRHIVLLAVFAMVTTAWHSPVDIFRLAWFLPIVNAIDDPVMYFSFFVVFEIAVLAGAAIDTLVRWAQQRRSVGLAAIPVVASLAYLFAQNLTFLSPTWSEPLEVNMPRGQGFYQVATVGCMGRATSAARGYFCLLSNIGTIDALVAVRTPEVAQPRYLIDPCGHARPNSAYRGEAYFLQSGNEARLLRISPNEIIVAVQVKRPGTLVVNQTFHRSWRTNCGRLSPHDGLLAIRLEKLGQYDLRLRYTPVALYGAFALSAAVLVCMIALFFSWRKPTPASRQARHQTRGGMRRLVRPWKLDLSAPRGRAMAAAGGMLCLAVAACIYVGVLRPRMLSDDLTYEAMEAVAAQDPSLAEALFRRALAITPRHGPALRELGRCCMAQHQLADAYAALDKATKYLPADPALLMELAFVCMAQGKHRQAEELARRVVAQAPLNPQAHACLAATLAPQQRNDAALRSLARAAELGYADPAWLRRSPLLAGLRYDPRFSAVLRQAMYMAQSRRGISWAPARLASD